MQRHSFIYAKLTNNKRLVVPIISNAFKKETHHQPQSAKMYHFLKKCSIFAKIAKNQGRYGRYYPHFRLF